MGILLCIVDNAKNVNVIYLNPFNDVTMKSYTLLKIEMRKSMIT